MRSSTGSLAHRESSPDPDNHELSNSSIPEVGIISEDVASDYSHDSDVDNELRDYQ